VVLGLLQAGEVAPGPALLAANCAGETLQPVLHLSMADVGLWHEAWLGAQGAQHQPWVGRRVGRRGGCQGHTLDSWQLRGWGETTGG